MKDFVFISLVNNNKLLEQEPIYYKYFSWAQSKTEFFFACSFNRKF